MQAIRYHEFGPVEVLREEEIPRPVPGPGQVLVAVTATSFNPVDDHIRLGVLAEAIPTTLPITPGLDVAGTVAELGEGVTGVQPGDRVVAMLPLDQHGGAAEFVVVPADLLASAPRGVDLADAAALPLTGLAARQAAVELAGISAGQSVLVIGAAGAVGSLVVQLAVDAGGRVTAVDAADPAAETRLLGYGAERVLPPLDLDAGPIAVGGPFDVVVNHVRFAPEELAKLTSFVADGGIAVSSAGAIPADDDRATRSANVWVAPSGNHLADLVTRVDGGRLALNVAERRPLAELPDVHRDSQAGRLRGKTVVTVA